MDAFTKYSAMMGAAGVILYGICLVVSIIAPANSQVYVVARTLLAGLHKINPALPDAPELPTVQPKK